MRGELEFFPGLVSIVKNCDKQERNSIELLKGGCQHVEVEPGQTETTRDMHYIFKSAMSDNNKKVVSNLGTNSTCEKNTNKR